MNDEYIDRKKLIRDLIDNRSFYPALVKNAIENAPTEDVVPRSEVEKLQEEANRYKRYYFMHDYDEMIVEVLDKLDSFINANCIEIKNERGIKGYVTSGVHFAISEFKKKYIGE